MTTQVQKALLTRSRDDIRKKLEELSRGLAPQEYSRRVARGNLAPGLPQNGA